jgi:hypothetical protein
MKVLLNTLFAFTLLSTNSSPAEVRNTSSEYKIMELSSENNKSDIFLKCSVIVRGTGSDDGPKDDLEFFRVNPSRNFFASWTSGHWENHCADSACKLTNGSFEVVGPVMIGLRRVADSLQHLTVDRLSGNYVMEAIQQSTGNISFSISGTCEPGKPPEVRKKF